MFQTEFSHTFYYCCQVYFLVAVLLAASEGCVVTGHKPVGAACNCSDACLGNSHCQHDGQGGFVCLCLVCQYYDVSYGQCVDIPDYGEACSSVCASNFVCGGSGEGTYTCQCPAGYNYDEKTHACVPRFLTSTTVESTTVASTTVESPTVCVNNSDNTCLGQADGDYPACFPECQQGIFVTCSNRIRYVRDCALGWYVRPSGERFTEKLVYDPVTKRCEGRTAYCPRYLDNYVEG
ncbi:hypothetical protein BsWGS_10555 [Bradybaena similaris]